MPHQPTPRRTARIATTSILLFSVVGLALAALALLLHADARSTGTPTLDLLLPPPDGLRNALDNLPELLAAVLGIALTVVAIVVQLASQRYSPKIVDLFMKDPVNIGVFSFMVASCILALAAPAFAHANPLPLAATTATLLLAIANFGLLLPYFAHVFDFLQPTNIINLIETDASRALQSALDATASQTLRPHQDNVVSAIERIADNCVAAIGQHDRHIAIHSVRTLEHLAIHCLDLKTTLPPAWHRVPPDHFFALSHEFYDEIVQQRVWVEAKALMEFEHILKRALGPMDELVTQLASSSRAIGLQAARKHDEEALALTIRFFNTYLRHALNARNVRASYNILYQYRLLAEDIMQPYPHLCERVVDHLVYYGRTANAMALPFVTVTVAHDVRILCDRAFSSHLMDVQPLLRLFLTLDQRSEEKLQELALLGVRKAQSMLGAAFLAADAPHLADQIRNDMDGESRARLLAIRDALLSVQDRKFWEITDRGINFDYIEPELRPHILRFFQPFLDA